MRVLTCKLPIKFNLITTVKPRNNKFEGTKHSYYLLPQFIIANVENKCKKYQWT